MSALKRLIVNADGLGSSTSFDEAVEEASRGGILRSASLRMDTPRTRSAVAQVQGLPGVGLGLHVVLCGGKPFAPVAEVPSLVDSLGRFPDDVEALSGADGAHVLAEVRAQLRSFRELTGRLPTHLDTHADAHRVPLVHEALITLAWELGLPVRALTAAQRQRMVEEGLPVPDHFLDGNDIAASGLDGLVERLVGLELGTTELRCPLPLGRDSFDAHWLAHREVRQAVQAAGVHVDSFEPLVAA